MKDTSPQKKYEPLLTVSEVADILRLSEVGVRKMIQEKRLPAFRFGKEYRIPQYAIDNLLSPFHHTTPEEAGFGMWQGKGPHAPASWVHDLRQKDKRSLQELLADLADL